MDFGVNRNGFLPLTEIHPDYFKIPIADQEKLKELSSKLQFDEEVEDNNLEITDDNNNKFNKDSSEDDTIEENNNISILACFNVIKLMVIRTITGKNIHQRTKTFSGA